jgi:anaerobic magnesium-protoporphyrin IX monomethyl ester cyclase
MEGAIVSLSQLCHDEESATKHLSPSLPYEGRDGERCFAKPRNDRLQLMDVILIYPYFYTHAPKAMLFHPQGIAQLAALLRQEGLRTSVVDCTFRQREAVLAEIEAAHPKIVGISIMVSMSDNALDFARAIRQRMPETLLVCGGPLPTLRPQQFSQAFDLVFCGEAVQAFPSFCTAYLQAGASLPDLSVLLRRADEYPGIYYQPSDGGATIQTLPQASDEQMLNQLPIPDRSDYHHAQYQQFWIDLEGYSLAGMMTTYGCPYHCDFCSKPIFGNWFRRRSMDRIFEEIQDIKTWGYTGLWIADDCLTLDLEHLRAFCQRLIAEKLDMRWCCLSRVDKMTSQEIDLMQASGCQKVFFGLESGSNDVLQLMHKQITTEMAEQTLNLFAPSSIRTAGFFMVGYPGETYDSIETTFQWALTLPLDEISFTTPYPLPGTRLFEKVSEVQAEADWQYENENRMVYHSNFDENYLKKRIEDVYAQFNAKHRSVKALL